MGHSKQPEIGGLGRKQVKRSIVSMDGIDLQSPSGFFGDIKNEILAGQNNSICEVSKSCTETLVVSD